MPASVRISLLLLVLTAFWTGSARAQSQLVGDLNSDYVVDAEDLWILADQWLDPNCLTSACTGDLDDADGVSMPDFALLAENWKAEEAHLVISELMARNSSTLADADGEYCDWVEIYNPTDTTVNLQGWYLTDNVDDPTRWAFPSGVELGSGNFLVVFASGKNRLDPNELHTGFGLGADGGYLALVAPDGSTIVHKYEPYPEQLADISYGLAQYASILVPTGATASYHVPDVDDAGADWTAIGFNDSGWDTGETGLGFGMGTDSTAIAIYRFDGDCSDSTGSHDGTGYGNPTYPAGMFDQAISLDAAGEYVETGKVASALGLGGSAPRTITAWVYTRSFNQGAIFEMGSEWSNGRDFSLRTMNSDNQWRVQYWGTDIDFTYTSKNRWVHFAHVHDGTATRIYADGQLIVPDTPRALDTADTKTFKIGRWWNYYFDGIIDDLHVYGQALSQEDIQTIMDTGMTTTSIQEDMLGVNASLWMRTEFDLELGEPEIFDTLMLRMKYEDGFVAYLNGQQVASRNAPDPVQWNSTSDSDRSIDDSSVFESINITAFMGALRAGRNVLAIHALNDHKDNGQFFILPELVAARNEAVPQYFTKPTPRRLNESGATGIVSEVCFSHERGFYNSSFQLTLATDMDATEIRYTTNGSRPTITHGNVYNAPIPVTRTSVIRAVAVKPGWLDSKVQTHTYLFVNDVVTQSPNGQAPGPDWPASNINGQIIDYGMDPDVVTSDARYVGLVDDALLSLPTISFVTGLDNLFNSSTGIYVNAQQDGRDWERPTSVELMYPDGSEGFQIDAGLRIRGGYGRQGSNPKHAFRLFFRNEYGSGKLNYPLFGDEGVDAFDKIDFRTAQNYSWSYKGSGGLDHGGKNTMVREVFSRDVQGKMGQPYTRSRYYHLYINGHYWGLFQTQERSEARYAESYLGGDQDDYDVVKVNAGPGAPYTIEATDGDLDAYGRLWQAAASGFGANAAYYRVQGLNTDGTPNPAYEKLVDIDNLIDYMLCTFYVGDFDAPISNFLGNNRPNNFYGVYNRNNPDGFKFFRHDAEHTMFELNENRTGPYPAGSQQQYFNPQWLHQQLAANPEYRLRFADRVHRHFYNDGVLSPGRANEIFVARRDMIDMAIIAESARWGDSKVYRPRTKDDDWLPEISRVINSYLPYRTGIVINQFKSKGWYPNLAAPTFNQHGGPVAMNFNLTMTASTGNVYYTLDGTDPRQPLTGNPVGILYSSQVTLSESSCVKARVLSGTTWSALNEAVFAVGPVAESLRINEIMYHPIDPADPNDPNDPNEEYIDLVNIGSQTINLNLVKFTNGVDFTFGDVELAPGQYVLVVEDMAAFEARYGAGLPVAGQYVGNLANNGERVELADAIGTVIHNFRYDDNWRTITDTEGYSLTIINPSNPDPNSWGRKDSWRASAYQGGSPGVDDSGILPDPGAVVFNEILAHSHDEASDWIELYNTTGNAIEIGGWYLSDSASNLKKYRIAPGTTIGAGQYRVFHETTHFGSGSVDPGKLVAFALSENGESIYLSSAIGGELTGYRESQDVGASATGVSFGRYFKTSTGNYNFVPMSYPTMAQPNAYPKVGPVIISEISYNPSWPVGGSYANNQYEFIEIKNISEVAITLYRQDKGAPWKITDGADFTFPDVPNAATIAAGDYLVIAKNPAAFLWRYPTVPSEKVLGPYDGSLDNGGERVQLSSPGDLDNQGVRQYIREDRVVYSDGSHPDDQPGGVDLWPTEADGQGHSLHRITDTLYGNDPNNWQADVPSPAG